MLKRKFDSVDDGGGTENVTSSNGQSRSDDSSCSNDSTDALAPGVASGPPPPKRMKKKVNFKGVSVFYFPRRQGFTCVPSEGGSTLGMSEKHTYKRDFSLSDYTKEQKRIHRAILAEQRRQGKMFPSQLLASSLAPLGNEEDVSSGSDSDSEYDDYYFLQPLPIRQRRVLLRTSGIKKIDNEEKDDCRDIRVSRNVCGCDCKVFCDPATCSCSLAGIQCQVDRLSFPCGCTKDGCNNSAGRIEFNPIRVRTHFIHTLMRLELERTDSHCPAGSTSASTSSFSHQPSATIGEIDVVGANGTESGEVSTDCASDDSCSGATTDASTSSGVKVLKSRLKTKKTEMIDLNMFNSNEKGSCRDCQNTDMCNVMMHDVKFSMVNQQQQRQQQRAIATTMGSQPGYPGSQGSQLQHHHHLSLLPDLSLLHPPTSLPPQQQPSSQHMLLFNDGEEIYHSENTSSVYFDNNDSSYEMSDTSSDVLESRPFSNVSHPRKFHVSPSQMFPSNMSSMSSSSNGTVHNLSLAMSTKQMSVNSSCNQLRQGNGGCGVLPLSTSCSNLGLEQQQSCGMLAHTQQRDAAAMSNQPLLRPPFLTRASQSGALTQRLNSQNGHLNHSHIGNNLDLDATQNSLMLQGTTASFQSTQTDMITTPVQKSSSPYKLDLPIQNNTTYSTDNSSLVCSDYLSQPSHNNFSVKTSVDFGNSTTSAVSNVNSGSYQSLQTSQQSCWSSSLSSPTLRECLGLSSLSPEAALGSRDQRSSQIDISCSTTYQQENESSANTQSPVSPTSSTITYATMTATTRDRIAAHCPGISSHMDGRPEPPTSTRKDSAGSFSNYHVTTEGSDTSSLVGTSQNLLYDLPYPDTSILESCNDVNATTEQKRQSTGSLMNSFSNESVLPSLSNTSFSQSLFTSPLSASITRELSSTSHLYSTEVSSSVSSTPFPLSSSSSISSSGLCQTIADTSFNQPQTSIEVIDTSGHTSVCFNKASHPNFQDKDISNISSTAEEMEKEESLNDAVKNRQSTSTHSNTAESHLTAWNSKRELKEHTEEVASWTEGNKELLPDVDCADLSSEVPEIEYDQDRNYEICTTDSEVVSSLSSSTAQSTASSSSSSPTSEEEKEQNMSQNFGEIIKESIVEMVLV